MSGIIDRRTDGSFVGRSDDGKFEGGNKPGTGIQEVNGGQGVYATPIRANEETPVEVLGASPAATPADTAPQPPSPDNAQTHETPNSSEAE